MEDYPLTLLDFEKRFSTEENCRNYLFKLRWPDGFHCPRCGNENAWPISNVHYQCTSCNYQSSVIAGTIFHKTRKPLTIWFRIIWWLAGQKNGASALGLKRILGLKRYDTAWTWLHKLRRAMVTPGRDCLDGSVEVDEAYIGGKKPGKRGRGAEGKALVFIAVEVNNSKTGRIRLQRIPDASAQSLEDAIKKNIQLGSKILTDGWKGYNQVVKIGFKHEVISQNSVIGEDLLPHCHQVVSLLKRWLLGTHQGAVRHKYLDYYLDEYTFRFNRRKSSHRGKLFYRLIQNAVHVSPTTRKQIIQKSDKL
jgi:transposase-like protein